MPRIFDRFYRGAQASDPAPRGSGLGLALAKWIAELGLKKEWDDAQREAGIGLKPEL